jgi:hypothetical protein
MDATDTKRVGETELASVSLIAAFCRRPNDRLFKNGLFFQTRIFILYQWHLSTWIASDGLFYLHCGNNHKQKRSLVYFF